MGNVLPDRQIGKYVEAANADRVAVVLLNAAASGYVGLTALQLASANAMAVALVDTTGAQLSLKNPNDIADGQLATSDTALYTVSSTGKVWITSIRLFNTNAATQTALIGMRPSGGGTTRTLGRFVMAQNQSAEVVIKGDPLALGSSAKLMGYTTTASAVDYLVSGEEL